MVCWLWAGVVIAQDDYYEGIEEFYDGAEEYLPSEDVGDVYIYNEGDTIIVPYPGYLYNPCVGSSPWMTEHSYPANQPRQWLPQTDTPRYWSPSYGPYPWR
jgi:hypothetical protein